MVAPLFARSRLTGRAPEILYNGITLGTPWPPRLRYPDEYPVTPPYLLNPPAVIPVDVGRQLFVDDFLIEETIAAADVASRRISPGQPGPASRATAWELPDDVAERTNHQINPAAMVFSDGVFFDPRDRLFKMWYMAGYGTHTCLATSTDGIAWSGRRSTSSRARTSSPAASAIRARCGSIRSTPIRGGASRCRCGTTRRSCCPCRRTASTGPKLGETGRAGDRSTFFYNPFRTVWVFSLRDDAVLRRRSQQPVPPLLGIVRFRAARDWNGYDAGGVGAADCARSLRRQGVTMPPELYNLDCVGYESVMLGLFSIWRGESDTREKINDVTVGFSRDGFHWIARRSRRRSCRCPRRRAAGTGPTSSAPAAAA